jgi:hypothetical protein
LRLWAFLGVRNEFQAGKPWRVVARLNIDFCRDGIAYWSNRRYRAISLKTFGNYETPMLFYVSHGYGGLARLLRRLPAPAITSKMAGALRMSFIMQRKERRS